MASLLLGVAGSALGSALLGDGISVLGATLTGAQIGGALGALAGSQIDAALTPGRSVAREGPRLTDLSIQASQEGAPIPRLYGRVRLAGQLIWASRFRETAATTTTSQGGKGGPSLSVSQTDYRYSISFAVGLCEGVTARLGRVWANGTLLVRGEKRMTLSQGEEWIQISGIVRVADINPDTNSILSSQLADARIVYSGNGSVQNAATLGWLGRLFNLVNPF